MYRQRESLTNNSAFPFCLISICHNTIPINGITTHIVASSCNFISAVSLYGIHNAIRHALHNPHMVDCPVIPPIKEYYIPRCRDIACVPKLPTGMEPVHTVRHRENFGITPLSR